VSTEFVAAIEDVLEVYAEPYDPKRPKVNFAETSKQLLTETRQPLPAQTGLRHALMTNTSATARAISFSVSNRRPAGGTCM
jgi:hypothetical protein